MKNIVVTGGNGLLGFEVIQLLSASNDIQVFSVQSDISNAAELPNVTYMKGDLSSENVYLDLPNEIFAVIHLAQSNNFRKFPEMGNDIFDVNIKATQRLLDYAVKAKATSFIFTSTGGVYQAGKGECNEDDTLVFNPLSGFYPSSKYIGELLVQNYGQFFNTTIFRPFFMYGKRQKKEMLIPRLINNVKEGNEIQLDGEQGLRINPIHVSDAAQAVLKSLELTGSHTINLAGNEVVSLKQLGEIIAEVFNTEAKFATNSSKQANDLIADTSKLISNLHKPMVNLKLGLTEFLENEK